MVRAIPVREATSRPGATSMYTQLLGLALDDGGEADLHTVMGEVFAELLHRRKLLRAPSADPQDLGAVADQLAYDVALIRLATSLGIDWDLQGFEQPVRERRLLEQALTERGIPLDPPEGDADPPAGDTPPG